MKTNRVIALVLLLGTAAQGESRFYRVASPTNSAVVQYEAPSAFTWTNAALVLSNSIECAADIRSNWTPCVTLPVTSIVSHIRLVVCDTNMAFIPAGAFSMGDHLGDGDPDERPIHTVNLTEFYIDKTEVTKALWDGVYIWATNNGYTFSTNGAAKGASHPVVTITYLDALKWCNARSEREGLTPSYYTDSTFAFVYRAGLLSVMSNSCVSWTSGGYRLPTEAEWEKAARGGQAGLRFPLGDTITHLDANYFSRTNESYDLSTTRGYHPAYSNEPPPYTSPVASFMPNGFGIYDMAGNVNEMCWDSYDAAYYSTSPTNDPRGTESAPGTGNEVVRGGGWNGTSRESRLTGRWGTGPGERVGFRCVR